MPIMNNIATWIIYESPGSTKVMIKITNYIDMHTAKTFFRPYLSLSYGTKNDPIVHPANRHIAKLASTT